MLSENETLLSGGYIMEHGLNSNRIKERFTFRSILPEEMEQAVEIETTWINFFRMVLLAF